MFIVNIVFVNILDIYLQGVWQKSKFADPLLNKLNEELPIMLIKSKAEGTVMSYKRGFQKWKNFAMSRKDRLSVLPAQVHHVTLYLVYLLQTSSSYSAVINAISSIAWGHSQAGYKFPTDHVMIKNLTESAARLLKKPVVKKEPFTLLHLQQAVIIYDDDKLDNLRFLSFMLLSFAGFFRSKEVLNIKVGDLHFHRDYLSIFIETSKTDQYRDGSWVIIAKTEKPTCPVSMVNRYMLKAGISKDRESLLFRSIYRYRGKLCIKNQKLSYGRIREIIKEKMEQIVPDITKYSLHSLRSGGATAAANAGVQDRMFKRHGRWISERAKDGYVKDNIGERLSVSLSLGI